MDLDLRISPYLKNTIFNERAEEWQDEQSIYPQTTTVGCYPLNKIFPETVASSRFDNLGIPIGLIYYNTRPVGYSTNMMGGNSETHKVSGDDDNDDDDNDDDNKYYSHSLNMDGGGEINFDTLVKDIVKEKPAHKGELHKTHNKTRKHSKK